MTEVILRGRKVTASDAMGWTVVLILTLMVCVGCARDRLVYVPINLPLPEISELPTVSRSELPEYATVVIPPSSIKQEVQLQCVSDSTYARLVQREELLKRDRDTCRAIIESMRQESVQ